MFVELFYLRLKNLSNLLIFRNPITILHLVLSFDSSLFNYNVEILIFAFEHFSYGIDYV